VALVGRSCRGVVRTSSSFRAGPWHEPQTRWDLRHHRTIVPWHEEAGAVRPCPQCPTQLVTKPFSTTLGINILCSWCGWWCGTDHGSVYTQFQSTDLARCWTFAWLLLCYVRKRMRIYCLSRGFGSWIMTRHDRWLLFVKLTFVFELWLCLRLLPVKWGVAAVKVGVAVIAQWVWNNSSIVHPWENWKDE